MQRRPNIGSAGTDFGFALLALVAGWIGLPTFYAAIVVVGALAAWVWTRRRPLAAMSMQQRLVQGAIAVVMIAVVLAIAYWIGLALGGHT
jgi:uncharacterized iron-regulated membrane protein